jgi:DNA-binding transcriptional regulator YdaS (Cro superfamily)
MTQPTGAEMAAELATKLGTQYAAALKVGVTPSTFNRWIAGSNKPTGLGLKELTRLWKQARKEVAAA